jgi:holin-like protein
VSTRWAVVAVQVAGLCLLFAGCQWVVARLHLPVPPGLLALVLLLVALLLRVVPESTVGQGGDLLLKILGALFVPPGIGLVKQFGLLRAHGVALVLTLLTALFVGQIVAGRVAGRWTRGAAR